ncbi:response regulator [Flavobacterium selenitireducens]|uniref:response regulator n=1 Tax=Flavobacterium selenitireducens TaxID=2722704 RepID=UPI00168B1CEE|nr:response regulator [Flavobacterium selenitireducens]MBD3582194.1 response regulator [Flavobacterium selenitireducens]
MNKIFFADDDPDDLLLFAQAMEDLKQEFEVFYSGDNIEDHLESPSLVFLDINMPKRTGFEILEIIRQKYSKTELPVIMFTTTNDQATVERARNAGANLFLVKPNSFWDLTHAVKMVLKMDWSEENEFVLSREKYLQAT